MVRGAEGRRGPAGAGAPATRAGQVGRRGAQRPAAGRPHRLQPEHAGEDEVMDVFTREAAVEPLQNKNAETVGRATKRAAKELTGDDGNFVVTTDLGNEFATLDRELPENAVHRTKRPEDRNAIAVVDRGIQTLKKDLATRVARPLSADRFGLQRAAPRDGARRARGRGEAAGHGVQGPPRQRRQVPAQQTAASRQWRTRALSEHRRTRRGASTLSTATCSGWGPWTP